MTLCGLVISCSIDISKEFASSVFHWTALKTEAGNTSKIIGTND